MRAHRTATVLGALALLGATSCTSTGAEDPAAPPAQGETSLVAYWQENPGLAPAPVVGATALLDGSGTGFTVLDLPGTGDHPTLTMGLSCRDAGDREEGEDPDEVTVGLGDERFVFEQQFRGGCGGPEDSGGVTNTFPADGLQQEPTRLWVLAGEGVRWSVGVWGSDTPFDAG
ncbi:hypothetical protein [Kineococcus sp. SYSU DK004]|uniref:hypothetical protein n=1 Tax=Kineococcus sp. SYSU DK004 TaxID=3383125 RepID=UPI003D7E5B04